MSTPRDAMRVIADALKRGSTQIWDLVKDRAKLRRRGVPDSDQYTLFPKHEEQDACQEVLVGILDAYPDQPLRVAYLIEMFLDLGVLPHKSASPLNI